MSFRRRALFLAGLFVAVSCSDAGNPVGPEGPQPPVTPPREPVEAVQALTCTVSVNDPEMRCAQASPDMGGASGLFIGGTNGQYVKLIKVGHNVTADSMWFNVRVQNLIGQTLGVDSTGALDPAGVRLYFETGPNATSGPGQVEVDTTTTGEGFLYGPETPFYQYAGMLADADTSEEVRWKFNFTGGTTSFVFTIIVVAPVQYPQGWLEIPGDSVVLQIGQLDSLVARARDPFGVSLPDGVTWTSADPTRVSVTSLTDSTAEVTALEQGRVYVRAVSTVDNVRRDSILVKVEAALDSIQAPSNVSVRLSAQRLRQSLATADSVVPNKTYETEHGHAAVDAQGGFTYVSDGGYAGPDTVFLDVKVGGNVLTNRLLVNVTPSNYWFVRGGAAGDGSNTRPLASVAAAAAAAEPGDTIFVLRDVDGTPAEGGALDADQVLIGEGVPATFVISRDALNEAGRVDTVFHGTAVGSPVSSTGVATLTLKTDNVLRGVSITSTNAAGIHGATFGTLRVDSATVSVEADGPALSLQDGTVDGVFFKLTSTNSDSSGISLVGVGGRVVALSGVVTGAATTAVSVMGGSTASINYPDAITHAGTGRLLDVSSHTGTVDFHGALTATAGTGLAFTNAAGTYTFHGAVSLNGGDAGLDVTNSDGVFTFAQAQITDPSGGPAVNVVGGTPALVYRGGITHNAGRAVVVDGITADSVVLRAAITSGTAASPTGLGILVQNVSGGRVALDSAKSLYTGTNPAVTLTGNTGGLVRFAGGMDITTTTGAGFTASGADSVIVTGLNSVSTGTGTPVSLTGVSTGTGGVSFASVSATGAANGIVLNGISGAGFQATGGTIQGTTGPAVLLTSTSAADSVSLRGMTLSRAGAGASVISGTTFGKLHLLNTTVSGTTGAGVLSLNGGSLSGGATLTGGMASATPVALTNVGGSLTADGSLSVALGGSGAVMDVNGGSVSVSYTGALTGVAATPLLRVTGGHQTGTLAFNGILSMTGTGSPGLRFENADGTYHFNVAGGTTALTGDSAGIDILPGTDAANGSQGTFQFGAPGNGFAITSGAGTAFNFQGSAADVTFHGGITRNGTQTGRMVDITGQRSASAIVFQTGTLSATSTSPSSTGILLSDADGTVQFNGTTTLNGGDAGIDVENGSAGTISFNGASSVTNAAGELIRIVNSAPTFTYAGSFQRTTGNAVGILAQGNTGGTITFNGDGTTLDGDGADVTKSLSTGTANAVSLVSNGGTTFQFAGGMTLATTSGTSFNATGGGTVNVSGAGNTANATAGTAVRITDTDIGAASGVVFRSVSASGGANGIFLQNTGNTGGGFGVMGDGATPGSGGTIANTTGADGATAGNGVYLNNARNVSLSWMGLSGHGNNGLYGTGVTGLTLNKMRFTGNNGTSNSGSFEESPVQLVNSGGSLRITNSRLDGGAWNGFLLRNTAGSAPTVDSLVLANDTVSSMQGGLADVRNTALQAIIGDGTADIRMRNNHLTYWWGNAIQVVVQNSGSGTARISGNVLNQTSGALAGAGGIGVSGGNLAFNVSNNSVNGTNGTAISADKIQGNTFFNGTIEGNTVGTAGVANSGSAAGTGIFVSHSGPNATTVKISNNTIRQINGTQAVWALLGDDVGGMGAGTLNATITGNNIAEEGTAASARTGIVVQSGRVTGDTDVMCADVASNTIVNFNTRIRPNQRFNTTMRMPGYTGAPGDFTAVNNYVIARNPGTTSVTSTSTAGGGGIFNTSPAGSACPQPIL